MTDLHPHRPIGWPAPPPPEAPADARRPSTIRTAVIAALVSALVSIGFVVPLTYMAATEDAPPATEETGASEPAAEEAGAGEPFPVETGLGEPAAVGSTGTEPPDGTLSIADIADTVAPSVARVDVQVPGGQGSGSAVVYRSTGYLLTNAHVVGGATDVAVTLPEGTRLQAEVVGADELTDLAVLRVETGDLAGGSLPAATFAEDLPRIGETAVAIGSPFELDGSVTAGIVSGLGRSIPGTPLADLIQTDAPINPGNSGGALVNDRGEVIGINTAILPASPTARGNIGIGFAIPVTTAVHLADQLIDQGFIEHAQLGVQGQDVDPRVAELYGLPVSEGALIVEVVPASAAADAGLARGDIVVAIDGEAVTSMSELAAQIRRRAPGDAIALTVVRPGGEEEIRTTLGSAQDGAQG